MRCPVRVPAVIKLFKTCMQIKYICMCIFIIVQLVGRIETCGIFSRIRKYHEKGPQYVTSHFTCVRVVLVLSIMLPPSGLLPVATQTHDGSTLNPRDG